jgi:hypothetical protein
VEYYELVKRGSVGLGMRVLLGDLEVERRVRLKTDASAAKGIASRKGLGKVRHVEVNKLWLQDEVGSGEIGIVRVNGEENFPDALAEHVSRGEIVVCVQGTVVEFNDGRHMLVPKVETRWGARFHHDHGVQFSVN